MIGEPIMGVAGMIVPPEDYWPRVRELLRAHGILLIFDEVVTAYGRTGEWFAAQHFGVEPDIIVTAKGITSGYMPLGAVLVTDAVAEVLGAGPRASRWATPTTATRPRARSRWPTSTSSSARACSGTRASRPGGYLLDRADGAGRELQIVGEVRGVGMMLALELVTPTRRRASRWSSTPRSRTSIRRDTGVIVRNCGHNVVLSPPLVMTRGGGRRAGRRAGVGAAPAASRRELVVSTEAR